MPPTTRYQIMVLSITTPPKLLEGACGGADAAASLNARLNDLMYDSAESLANLATPLRRRSPASIVSSKVCFPWP